MDAARFTALRREQPEPPPSPPCSPPCSPPSSPAGTRPPTPTPPASPIKCVDAENNLVAIMAPAALLEQQDFAHALMLLASQPPQLPRPPPTPCLMEAVSGASKKQSCAALSTCTAEVMPAPAELAPASMAPPMLGPGYPSDIAGDGPASACVYVEPPNVPGNANSADALTKHVAPSVFREYTSRITVTDDAPESRSKSVRDYLAESLAVREVSTPYSPTQVGAQEERWSIIVPNAGMMLGSGYPSDAAGDGPISACCGERWTECDGCGWVVCPLCLNVDLFELVEDTGGRVRRERTAGCAHQYRISRCSWLVTGTDGQGRRLPVCGCHREYLKLEDSDGD